MSRRIRFSSLEFPDAVLLTLPLPRCGNEIRSEFGKAGALLPIHHRGDNKMVLWGNWNAARLPRTGFCKKESLEAGKWQHMNPQKVKILASSAWSGGVWFQVRQGIHGILVYDADEIAHCYMITQPATHYFKIMTGADRMPALIEQII
jgi:hypothetical protein